jgi:hypothetical protein
MDEELRGNVTPLGIRKNKEKSDGLEHKSLETSLKIFQKNIRGLRKPQILRVILSFMMQFTYFMYFKASLERL